MGQLYAAFVSPPFKREIDCLVSPQFNWCAFTLYCSRSDAFLSALESLITAHIKSLLFISVARIQY